MLARLGLGGGALASRALIPGGIAAALTGLLARPAAADQPLDVQILQTASSLEILAVATYGAALGLDFIKNGNPVVVKFAQTTMIAARRAPNRPSRLRRRRWAGRCRPTRTRSSFPSSSRRSRTSRPRSTSSTSPSPSRTSPPRPTSRTSSLLDNSTTKALMASVMGVETQHAATLRAVKALLEADLPDLIKIPIGADVAKLPAAAGQRLVPERLRAGRHHRRARDRSGQVNPDNTLQHDGSPTPIDRRRFLLGAGAAAGVVVVAGACGRGDGGRKIRTGAPATPPAPRPAPSAGRRRHRRLRRRPRSPRRRHLQGGAGRGHGQQARSGAPRPAPSSSRWPWPSTRSTRAPGTRS